MLASDQGVRPIGLMMKIIKTGFRFLAIYITPLSFIFIYYGNNANKLQIQDIILSLMVALASASALYVLLKLITKSWEKAVLSSGVFYFLFFNHDNISRIFYLYRIIPPGHHFELFVFQKTKIISAIILGILFIGFVLYLAFKRNAARTLYQSVILFSIGMIGIVIGSLVFPNLQRFFEPIDVSNADFYKNWQQGLTSEASLLKSTGELPDIYYIILDGYGREDVLKDIYGFDNESFINALKKQGFEVSNRSLANYKQTDFSLSSLLNMDYLNWIGDEIGTSNNDYLPLYYILDHNRVFEQLHRIGYRIDTFASGFGPTEFDTSDVILKPGNYPNNFEIMIINATPLSLFWDNQLYAIHRQRVLYSLQNLAEAGELDGPDFVFAHIAIPHPPFIFGADGEEVNPGHPYNNMDGSNFFVLGSVDEYKSGYTNQLTFVSEQVLSAINEIKQKSANPPIIFIQGDHGPASEFNFDVLEISNLSERYPILYTYYNPCSNNPIPQDITPVNSFRYIFNTCFNANLPYLENKQYYSPMSLPYQFTDVTNSFLSGR